MARIPIIYVAHPFGGNPDNLVLAEEWCAFLSFRFNGYFIAPWIALCRAWPNGGAHLTRGTELNFVAIRAADALLAVGGKRSPGMLREIDCARDNQIRVVDLSPYTLHSVEGCYAPSDCCRSTLNAKLLEAFGAA